MLAAAAAATIAGATSVAAIAEWTADAGDDVLARLGIGTQVPSLSTFHRILRAVYAHRFDLLVYAWIRLSFNTVDGHRVIARDGKTLRGAVDARGNRPHLLSAYDHTAGASIGQVEVHHKTNEIPLLADLLAQFDGVCPVWVGDQDEQSVCVSIVLGPDPMGGDTEGTQAGDVAGPVHRRVLLECFDRPQGVDPELVHGHDEPLVCVEWVVDGGDREAGRPVN